MARKLTLKLTPDLNVHLSLNPKNIKFSRSGLLWLIEKVNLVLWVVFLLAFFSAHLFTLDVDLGSLFWVYGFMILLLGIQICKKILSKGDYFPIVAYDAQLLFFTTFTAVSLLFTTVTAGKGANIWGGADLRFISGLSIIAFWFLYYLIISNFAFKNGFAIIKNLLLAGLLLAVLISGIFGSGIFNGLATIYIVLLPAFVWMTIAEEKFKGFYLLNILISLFLWRQVIDPVNTFVVWFTFLLLVLFLVAKNYRLIGDQLRQLNTDIDKLIARKIAAGKIINKNSEIIYLVFAGLISLIGLAWLIANHAAGIFTDLNSGFTLLTKSPTIMQVILGHGLTGIAGSFFTQFIYSYGLLPTVMLLSAIFLAIKDLLKFLMQKDMGKLYLFAGFLALIMIMVLAKVTDIIFITFWLFFALIGLHKLFQIDKKVINTSQGVRDASPKFSEKVKKALHLLQIFAVIIITTSVVYILSLISKLTSFINR